MTQAPRILLNGVPVTLEGVSAATTLLDWLREHAGLRGTKEGCAEGDCGACTVVLERRDAAGGVAREAINACLAMVGQLDGIGVRTVEGLAAPDGRLHPVQAAFGAGGATQCGFCTPGFVMAAYAFAVGGEAAETALIHDALAGNLCRCTGYRPIVAAVASVAPLAADPIRQGPGEIAAALDGLADGAACFEDGGSRFHVPRTLAEAAALRAQYPQAHLLAGGTDLGLLASRQRERLERVVHLGKVAELNRLEVRPDGLVIGAAVTYARAFAPLIAVYPELEIYLTRLGSRQIRNMGTIGGNIGTASPIGDFLPVLLAVDARIALHSAARGRREVAADAFFAGYRQTALAPDELIADIALPSRAPGTVFFVDKLSKRRDQDISTVCGAYRLLLEQGIVRDVRIAYGGLAATPKRALAAEAALRGRAFTEATASAAAAALAADFQPISDWRGSAAYRMAAAGNLLRRLQLRVTGATAAIEVDAL